MMATTNWYVLYVKSKWENRIEKQLNNSHLEIEAFSPSLVEVRQYSDRKKRVKVPILKGIVLIKTLDKYRNKVFIFPGTLGYLRYLGSPGVVKEREIDYLKKLTQKPNILSVEFESLNIGDQIELNRMGFKNENGVVQKITKHHVWVLLDGLGHILKVSLK